MAANVQTISINEGSDGDASKWPTADKGFQRNDRYWCEKMGERWMKESGASQVGLIYQIDRLPHGFAGFEKYRPDNKHVDRYIYGHPRGVFRSTNEFWPHFQHLMDHGTSTTCTCTLCVGKSKRPKQSATSNAGSTNGSDGRSPVGSRAKPKPKPKSSDLRSPATQGLQMRGRESKPRTVLQQAVSNPYQTKQAVDPYVASLPQGRLPDLDGRLKRSQVDEDGTSDVYRVLLDELKAAGPEGALDKKVTERMSPDWRVGNSLLTGLLDDWSSKPAYLPRCGDLVLFTRRFDRAIGWDQGTGKLRYIDPNSGNLLECPDWEAGVVTQMPSDNLNISDITSISNHRLQSVNYSGFRIEPLPEPGNNDKHHTRTYKYVPLHAVRPMSLWKTCVDHIGDYPTILHALSVSSSFCLIQPYRFKGTWPEATLFLRGAYIGHEFLQIGDLARLTPKGTNKLVTDVMQITSIRCVFVRLDDANDDDQDEDSQPYNTCLHFAGRLFTLDVAHSFDPLLKAPLSPDQTPAGLEGYGTWFSATDPGNPNLRVEIPYTRVLGRCPEHAAVAAWLMPGSSRPVSKGFQAVNAVHLQSKATAEDTPDISFGLGGILEAREYSTANDRRIDKLAGKSWFWANTRIEQLDLHEVNDRQVGQKDTGRGWKQMERWKRVLKAMEGKKDALENLAQEREDARLRAEAAAKAKGGLLAGAQMMSFEEEESDEKEDEEQQDEGVGVADGQNDELTDHTNAAKSGSSRLEDGVTSWPDGMDVDGNEQTQQRQQPRQGIDLGSDASSDDEVARQQVMGKFLGRITQT